jgi:hypothetical protein
MTSSGKEVKFLAVARKSDKSILASHIASADRSYDYVANVTKVLNSPGWASVTTDKLSLDDPPNVFYVSIDEGGRVFIVITSKGYPSRYIYGSADGNTRGILAGTWRVSCIARHNRLSPLVCRAEKTVR